MARSWLAPGAAVEQQKILACRWGGHRSIDRTSVIDAVRRDPRVAQRLREISAAESTKRQRQRRRAREGE